MDNLQDGNYFDHIRFRDTLRFTYQHLILKTISAVKG